MKYHKINKNLIRFKIYMYRVFCRYSKKHISKQVIPKSLSVKHLRNVRYVFYKNTIAIRIFNIKNVKLKLRKNRYGKRKKIHG